MVWGHGPRCSCPPIRVVGALVEVAGLVELHPPLLARRWSSGGAGWSGLGPCVRGAVVLEELCLRGESGGSKRGL